MAVWQGFQPKAIDVFGGLVTNVDRNDLGGAMVSPNCQDVEFTVGSVHSRRGTSIFWDSSAVPINATIPVTAMFSDWQPSLGPVTVCYFSSNTGAAVGDGTIAAVGISGGVGASPGTNVLKNINTYTMFGGGQFSRFWMGFPTAATSGTYGSPTTVPRVFDYNASQKFYRAGLPRPSVQGCVISEIASTGNTMTAGQHYFRINYEGTDGSISAVSGVLGIVSTGGPNTATQITNIPCGPPGTARRVVWATSVADSAVTDTQSYYTLRASSMIINDNTTTTVVVAFTDSVLTAGESASSNALFTLMEPPPAKGVVFYKNRAFWFHLLGAVQQGYMDDYSTFNNMEWDADWSAYATPGVGLRGYSASNARWSVVTGDGGIRLLRGTADGAVSWTLSSFNMGTSSAGTSRIPTLTKGKKYGFCFRARRGSQAFAQGNLKVVSLVSAGSATYSVTLSSLTTAWQTFYTGTLFYNFDYAVATANNPGYNVVMDGTPTSGSYCELEPFTLYDSGDAAVAGGGQGNAWQGSLVLASKPFYPGTCDGATGLQLVARDDGEHINAAFVFRDNLYFVKNHSIYVTADNGVTEPGGWTIQNVSKVCGTYSPSGVVVGDSFVIICGADGVYYFDGGAPEKISQEIAPTWSRIPTARLYEISVTLNQVDKQVIISVPLDAETTATHQIVLDYTEGFGDPLPGNGHGRKWTIWTTAGSPSSCAFFADWGFSNTPFLLLGRQDATLIKQDSAQTTDYGNSPFTAFYETAPVGYGGPGVSYFGGLILNANGTSIGLSYTNPFGTNTTIGTYPLTNPMTRVTQAALNLSYETIGIRMGGTSKWSVNNVWCYVKSHPYFNVRGLNP